MPACPVTVKQRDDPPLIGPPEMRVSTRRWCEASSGMCAMPLVVRYPVASTRTCELAGLAATQTWALVPMRTIALLAMAYSDTSKFNVDVAGVGCPLA